jgi:hypothetical protein
VKTPFVNLDTEQDKVESPRAIPVPVFRDLKACAPGVKLSRLQRWMLRAALEGVSKGKERALLKRESLDGAAKELGLPHGLARVSRSQVGHVDRSQILAGYFRLPPRGAPRETWWRRWPCDAIPHPAYRLKTVGDLTPALLEAAVQKWCPKVRERWERVNERTRKTYQAILEARMEPSRKTLYNRANASICKALRRLRERGLLEQALHNRRIRLTPKGRKVARKL